MLIARRCILVMFFALGFAAPHKIFAQTVTVLSDVDFGQYDFSQTFNVRLQLATNGSLQVFGSGVSFNGGENAGHIRITTPDTGIVEIKCAATASLYDASATTLTIENVEISVNTGVAFGSGDSCNGLGAGDAVATTIDMDAIPDPDVYIGGEIVVSSPITLPTDQGYSTTGSGTPIMLSIVVQQVKLLLLLYRFINKNRFCLMSKFRCLILCALFAFSYNIPLAKADAVLFFSPTRVEIEDGKPVQEIRVTNMSDIARSYNLSLQNLVMNEDGVTVPVDTFDFSAKRMLRFVPRQFDIQPGKKQIIRIMARFPEGTEDGDYHAHLEFLENVTRRIELNKDASPENQARARAQVAYAAAIPVVISKGEVKTDVAMKDVKITRDEKAKKASVALILERSGNGQGNIYLEADYIAPDGAMKKAAVRRSVYVYRELGVRNHSFLLELLDDADLQKGGQVKVRLYNRDVSETDPIDEAIVPLSQSRTIT